MYNITFLTIQFWQTWTLDMPGLKSCKTSKCLARNNHLYTKLVHKDELEWRLMFSIHSHVIKTILYSLKANSSDNLTSHNTTRMCSSRKLSGNSKQASHISLNFFCHTKLSTHRKLQSLRLEGYGYFRTAQYPLATNPIHLRSSFQNVAIEEMFTTVS